jgi:hypothetical protein
MHNDLQEIKIIFRRSKWSPILTIKGAIMATYLTTEELSARIKYDIRTIRDRLKDSVLIEGRHYFRPFGGRKILFIWEQIEQDMFSTASLASAIPMTASRSM